MPDTTTRAGAHKRTKITSFEGGDIPWKAVKVSARGFIQKEQANSIHPKETWWYQ